MIEFCQVVKESFVGYQMTVFLFFFLRTSKCIQRAKVTYQLQLIEESKDWIP